MIFFPSIIFHPNLENFPDTCSTCALWLQYHPVPQALTIEDHLVDNRCGDNFPLFGLRKRKHLLHERAIQGVFEIRQIIGDDEIEEGFQLGISVPFGGLGAIFCDYFEKMVGILAIY